MKKNKDSQSASRSSSTPTSSKKGFTSKDFTSLVVGILSVVVIVAVLGLSYMAQKGGNPQSSNTQTENNQGEGTTSGVQTATITILPSGSTANAATQQGTSSTMQVAANTMNADEHGMMAMGNGSQLAGDRVKYKITTFKKLAAQPLEFELFDANKKALTDADLKTVHGEKIHYIVVSANLREYQHLHPTFSNGKWRVKANLPNPGTYYAYIDIQPVQGNAVVLRSNFIVQTETKGAINYPGLTPNLYAIANGFSAQMGFTPQKPVSHAKNVLTFQLTSLNKAVALALQTYLEAYGHVIILGQNNVDAFIHTHQQNANDIAKGLVSFEAQFSTTGRYTAFAEFKLNGRVYVFPITFDVTS